MTLNDIKSIKIRRKNTKDDIYDNLSTGNNTAVHLFDFSFRVLNTLVRKVYFTVKKLKQWLRLNVSVAKDKILEQI